MNIIAIQVRWKLTSMPGFQHDPSTAMPTSCLSPLVAIRLANGTSNLSRKAWVEHIVDTAEGLCLNLWAFELVAQLEYSTACRAKGV